VRRACAPATRSFLEDARKGVFDVIVAEALDRFSRDQEDVAGLYKQLSFCGVKLLTLAEGEISELHVGLKGTMNAPFLKDLALKTRRGLEGRVRAGRSGGGLCYGYTVVRQLAANGEAESGLRQINAVEASTVRRIFTEFAAGKGPRAIARDLNSEGVPGPQGRPWGDTTIWGHSQRGTGILNNELYAGRLVWNKQRYVRDPLTGKRIAQPNPRSEWIVQDVPAFTRSPPSRGRKKPSQPDTPPPIPALRTPGVRHLRGRLYDPGPGPLCLRQSRQPRHLRERTHDQPKGD
jgi:site-specific DNA recombinase